MQGAEPEEVELEAALDLLRQRALRPPSARSRRKQPVSKGTAVAAADSPRGKARAKAEPAARAAKAPRAATARPRGAAAEAGAADPEPGDSKPKRRAAARGAGAPDALPAKAGRRAGGPAGGTVSSGAGGGAEGEDPRPKRPLSAYLRFCGQERGALRAAQPELKPPEARPCMHVISLAIRTAHVLLRGSPRSGRSPDGRSSCPSHFGCCWPCTSARMRLLTTH